MTDDPRGILRETRAASRAAESEDDGGTPVSSARRPRASSSFGAARNVSDETGTSDARGGSFVPDESSSSAAPRTTETASSTRQTTTSVFTTLVGTRAFVRESREAAASLDAPALGLAKPSEAELERLRQTARVLPDASGGARFSCEWRLREDEVVLVMGCTPPPAKYFGITPYVYKSYDGGQVRTLFASAGDTLSMGGDEFGVATFSRLGTSAGRVPPTSDGTLGVLRDVRSWNATFAAAFGGHRNTLKESIDALTNALRAENENENENVSIPGVEALANAYGLSRVSGVKTRALMIRHAVPSDAARWRAYAEAPPLIVMRLTPKRSPTFPAPFPRASLIQRETFDERLLASSVALVADRVAAFFERGGFDASGAVTHAHAHEGSEKNSWFDVPGRYTTRTISTSAQVLFDNGYRCVDVSWNCGGDNRDTTYVNGPRFRLPDDSTVAYVIGANHVATKNAVYANVAVYDPARKLGVLAIDDGEFENTAERWTRDTPAERDAPRLFVVALARKCPSGDGGISRNRSNRSRTLDGALCVEVPSDGFPSASPTAELAVWERPYCHAETTVGPWWSRLATPTVVLVRRVGEAPAQQTPFTFDVNTF